MWDPMYKQRLVHWVVDITTKAYEWAEHPDDSYVPLHKEHFLMNSIYWKYQPTAVSSEMIHSHVLT